MTSSSETWRPKSDLAYWEGDLTEEHTTITEMVQGEHQTDRACYHCHDIGHLKAQCPPMTSRTRKAYDSDLHSEDGEQEDLAVLPMSLHEGGVRPQPGSEGHSEEGGNHSTEGLPIPELESLRSQRSLTMKNSRDKNHPKILNRIFRKGRAHQRE